MEKHINNAREREYHNTIGVKTKEKGDALVCPLLQSLCSGGVVVFSPLVSCNMRKES
jgi:hypothetical protein